MSIGPRVSSRLFELKHCLIPFDVKSPFRRLARAGSDDGGDARKTVCGEFSYTLAYGALNPMDLFKL